MGETDKFNSGYSYQYEVFTNFQKKNDVIPKELLPYCMEKYYNSAPDLSLFSSEISDIIKDITSGIDPNEIYFKNTARTIINKLHDGNYTDSLDQILKLRYSSVDSVKFLINEIILCAINIPMAQKGYNITEMKNDTVPEMCANLCKNLLPVVFTMNDCECSFGNELVSLCNKYFNAFLDPERKLDKHNINDVDKFKGFMTLLGLLFNRNVLRYQIMINCVDNIRDAIFTKGEDFKCIRQNIECDNLYRGYQHLLKHIIKSCALHFENNLKTQDKMLNRMRTVEELRHTVSNEVTDKEQLKEAYNMLDKMLKELIDKKRIESSSNSENLNLFLKEELTLFSPEIASTRISSGASLNDLLDKSITESKPVVFDILDTYLSYLREVIKKMNDDFIKQHTFVNGIIERHIEFKELNEKYRTKSDTKGFVKPISRVVLSTHDILGGELNDVNDMISDNYFSDIKKTTFYTVVKELNLTYSDNIYDNINEKIIYVIDDVDSD